MTVRTDFFDAYEALFEAYKAAEGADTAYARMTGALKVIVGFEADERSLAAITQSLHRSVKQETINILSKEHSHV